MTSRTDMAQLSSELADFEARLARQGADLGRWPAVERAAADNLLARSREARRLMDEAIALERALDAAPATMAVVPSQVDRVLAAALAGRPAGRSPSAGDVAASVVSLPRRDMSKTTERVPEEAPRRVGMFGSGAWKAAAVLAFALIGGVAIGAFDIAPTMVAGVGELVGLATESDLVVATFPVEGLDPLIDEEQI